jgi:2-dehydro-3-deoxyglucarate aldolase
LKNAFKQIITARGANEQHLFGGWHMSNSPVVLEAMGHGGYEYVVIDMEHGTLGIHGVAELLRALGNTAAMPVIRMPSHDPITIKHALDLGAMTVCFPFVQNGEQAAQLARSCYYPPVGDRGFARMLRASRFTAQTDYLDRANEEIAVIAQLETVQAIEQLESIARTPGITGVFVGPGDLAVTMGLKGDVTHPQVRAQMEKVGRWCKDNHVPLGTVLPTPELVKWAFDCGYNFSSMGSDLGTLMGGIRAAVAAVKA